MDYIKGVDDFLTFLRECRQSYNIAQADLDETNNETLDILHALELCKSLTFSQKGNFAKKLSEIRKKRRKAKDSIHYSEQILSWVDSNKEVIKSLERLLGDLRKEKVKQDNRIYVPRTSVLPPDVNPNYNHDEQN